MKVNLVSIGNSRGVRIPQAIIKECGLGDQVEMRVRGRQVIVTAAPGHRKGWNAAFEKMAAAGDDVLLIPSSITHDWDDEEWEC